ncbi:MAG TPA: DsbA family protein [Methylomirabilota bacterium]|nr:DsbA family protein [Methylomirabilota bacterium]
MHSGSRSRLRASAGAAVLALALAGPATVGAQDTITREQADTLIREIRELRQAIDRLRAPARPAERPPDEKVRVDLTGVHVLGRTDAPLTLVEFTDLECPFCRTFHVGAFERIKREYIDTGKLRFVSRDFPLDFHPNARPAALAVRCAGEQGKFWEMRHQVTLKASALGPDVYVSLARDLKLDLDKLSACISSEKYRAEIDRDMADGMSAGVTGTPSFVLGRTSAGPSLEGVRIVGAQPYAAFESRIKALLGP